MPWRPRPFRRLRVGWVSIGEDGGNALIGERTDGGRPGRHGLGPGRGQAAVQSQDAQAGVEVLLGVRAPVQDGNDEPHRLGPDLAGPALGAGRPPFRVATASARHVLGIGAVSYAGIWVTVA